MSRALLLIGLCLAFVGCDEVGEFFETKPCSDDCKWEPGFQNCQWCKCSEAQRSDPEHVCCQGGDCKKSQASMNPQCGLPDNGVPQLAIVGLQTNPVQPDCAQAFNVLWNYANLASGDLKPPAEYELPATLLQVLEVAVSSDPPPFEEFRTVPWGTIAPCGTEPRSESFSEGLIPRFSTVGTYSLGFVNTPPNTQVRAVSFDVHAALSNPECPPP